ncbi:hypothetical protein E9677_16005 [Rhizobium rhizophilum]|uniref:YcaO domain-containing protein n=2 Tax=Rhizobium rhizophilum TaxID=1850373 RepID=A0ABY2QRC0_9HYPH|nr:hypothetical protein E9677_16005 [Rhizobium rhizophilum]
MKTDSPAAGAGEFRACRPLATLAKVAPHLGRLGITRVASQTGLDRLGIPVWCAFAPNAKAIVIAQGKGLDHGSARVSAVMEAVERIVATEPGCRLELATASDHAGAGRRYHCLDGLIARHQMPLSAVERVAWVEADDLVSDGRIWLPFDAVNFDRTRLVPRYWQSSDGLASGNTAKEAILHGLLERVERDALALWTVTSGRRRFARRIDTDRITFAPVLDLLSKVKKAGLQLCLLDITTDLGIPCVAALLAPENLGHGIRYVDLTLGAGAALTPEGAITRALLEAVQSRMTFIAGARDDLLPSVFERAAELAHLAAFSAPACIAADDMPTFHAVTTHSALDLTIRQLATRGVSELFCVELGHDWLPVNVVKVFAPQLENPDGARRLRFGPRALSRSLQ